MLSQAECNYAVEQKIENLSEKEYLNMRKAKKNIDWESDWLFHLMGGENRSKVGKEAYIFFLMSLEKRPVYLSLFLMPSFAHKNEATDENHHNILCSSLRENIMFLNVSKAPQGADGVIELESLNMSRIFSDDNKLDVETKRIEESPFFLEIGDVSLAKVFANLLGGTPICTIPYENSVLKKLASYHKAPAIGALFYPTTPVDLVT